MMRFTTASLALTIALSFSTPVHAAVVNVDFGQPGDATHAGSDGALSAGGSVWNGVALSDVSDLVDESGAVTSVALTYLTTSTPSGFNNLGVFNDLQDTGVMCDGFEIRNLVAGSTYTLAVYSAFITSFYVEHEGGFNNGACTGFTQTNVLPGTEGDDYCLRTDLVAMELSPGVYGLRVGNVSGPLLGFQLVGETGVVPAADETAPDCWLSSSSDGPPRSIQITAQDSESGLGVINVLVAENATVTVPTFDSGANDAVVLDVVQVDPTAGSLVQIELVDMDGNLAAHDFELTGTPPVEPEPTDCASLLTFFDESMASGTLRGSGPGKSGNGRRGALRNMLESACSLAEEGLLEDACAQLGAAAKKCDGEAPDFVTGDAASELEERIGALKSTSCGESETSGSGRGSSQTSSSINIPMTWGLIKTIYN